MGHFFRLIYNGIVDFFVRKAEEAGNCRHQFLKDSPYFLGDRELERFFGYFTEESSDGFVVAESSGRRKDVVLEAAQSGCYLGGETGALALPEAEVRLAVLEHNLQGPASGIYFPSFEEIQPRVGSKQTVPFASLCAPDKEQPDRDTPENGVINDVVASEHTAIFLQFEFLPEFYKGRGGEVAMLRMIFRLSVLADLYHSEPVAFDTAAVDELDDFLIGEPAVGQ